MYDYIQEEKRLFIYAIDKDTNRPIQIDAEQDLDYFEDYDNLTIFIEEKGSQHIKTYFVLQMILYHTVYFYISLFLQSGRIRLIFYLKLRKRFWRAKPVMNSSNSF